MMLITPSGIRATVMHCQVLNILLSSSEWLEYLQQDGHRDGVTLPSFRFGRVKPCLGVFGLMPFRADWNFLSELVPGVLLNLAQRWRKYQKPWRVINLSVEWLVATLVWK